MSVSTPKGVTSQERAVDSQEQKPDSPFIKDWNTSRTHVAIM